MNDKFLTWLEDVEFSLLDRFGAELDDLDTDYHKLLKPYFDNDFDCEDVAGKLGHRLGLRELN